MSTDGARIEIRGIEVEIVRKDIKHLHLGVYPPEGRVRVAAPLRLDDDAVRLAVISRLAWIRRKRAEFQGRTGSRGGSSLRVRAITSRGGDTDWM